MIKSPRRWCAALALSALLAPAAVRAQSGPRLGSPDSAAVATSRPREPAKPARAPTGAAHDMAGMDMGGMPMTGMYDPYGMSREATGTSWQPDAARHEGVHVVAGAWRLMLHGSVDGVLDDQGGPRGDTRVFASDMGMAMAQRPLGPGTLGLRTMVSLEPASIGRQGYPLLLQSGETADGRTPLVDRQHPHDLFMELAASYSVASGDRSLFVYGGLPGEPALGPPAFMHRFSGENLPVAPITHHWLDSTHISYGVLTAGVVVDRVKLEASAFRGREPDQDRWNLESPKLDSQAFRLSVNPTDRWALQASYGRLHSPEQLEPDVDQDRVTATALYDGAWGATGRWEGMLGWGQDRNRPGHRLDAFTAEGAFESGDRHTLFARLERVQKDELFLAPDARAGQVFAVGELSGGYRYDFLRRDDWRLGVGAAGTLAFVPDALRSAYGDTPASALLFVHAGLQ